MGRLHAVFYTENYAYGGLERFLFEAVETLPTDWDATVLHNDYPGFADRLKAAVKRPVKRLSVPIESRPLAVNRWSRRVPRLAARAAARAVRGPLARRHFARNAAVVGRALDDCGSPQVLHIVNGGYPGGESCAAAAHAAAERRVPRRLMSVLSLHDPAQTIPPPPEIESRLVADLDAFVTNCEASRQALLRHRRFPEDKVITVHTGIPAPRPNAANAARLRERWIGDGSLLIGCLGVLYPLKGHRFLLDAAPAILAKCPGTRFVLVGDGESADDLKAQAKALGIERAVSFPGYYDGDSADALAAFDILAHPTSLREGLPYAVLEAMALEKPIVATSVGGVPEAVIDGETGLLAPPGDARALGDGLIRLALDPELRRRLSANALSRQRAMFDLGLSAEKMRALYAPRAATPGGAA